MSALDLLEIINVYRVAYEGKSCITHKELLSIIRKELGDKEASKFSDVYMHAKYYEQPDYVLPKEVCMRILLRESSFMRNKIVELLEEKGIDYKCYEV